MTSERLVALTDGVIAVIMTIMVLDMKAPAGAGFAALRALWPVFLSYVLSFFYLAIYWNNHHHFYRLIPHVTGPIMWANLHLLFWLSLVPFATAWTGEHPFAAVPAAAYGGVLLACAVAWTLMQSVIIAAQGEGSALHQALGRDLKGKLSPALYLVGIALAFLAPWLSYLFYAGVAVLWVIPDRRVEATLDRS
ncbi:MAG: TMEM175 family protein [Sphingomonadales bacterium]